MLGLPLLDRLGQLSNVAGKTQTFAIFPTTARSWSSAPSKRSNEFESGKMIPQDPNKAQDLPPLPTYDVTIRKEWIDRNDHMNNSFYLVASQEACLGALRLWRGDFTEGSRSHFGNFVTQALVTYIREVRSGIRVSVRCRLVSCDEKRSHVYAEMIHAENSKLLATVERTSINVLRGHPPKVVPYPDAVQANLSAVQRRHAAVPFLEKRSPLLQLKQNRSTSAES